VKVLFLWLPCETFTPSEVNVLKAFASEGGRIIFVGEHDGFYGSCIPTENQLLIDLATQGDPNIPHMRNVGRALDGNYNTIPLPGLRHQITTGMQDITVAASSQILPGPNDFPLYFSREDPTAVLAGVARIDVTPLPIVEGIVLPAAKPVISLPPLFRPDGTRVPPPPAP
jgi:hypothetical protein